MKKKDNKVIRKIIALYDEEWLELDAQVQDKKLKNRSSWMREKISTDTFE